MSAELAGLFATQNPGKESKIPTFTSPPYFGLGIVDEVVDDDELDDVGTEDAGAIVVLPGSLVVLDGNVVSVSMVDVVSLVDESEHAVANNVVATRMLRSEIFL